MGRKHCFSFWDGVCTYEEKRVVRIHSFSLALIYWLGVLAATIVIVAFYIFYKKGYQEFDDVESAVTTKLFGVAKPSDPTFRKVWDNADYMVPPKENGAFTVITSVLVTHRQLQGICEEDPHVPGAQCQTDADCPAEQARLYGNGIMTGRCINSNLMPGVKVCQISAWCPVEFDDPAKRVSLATENFTVFIRNDVKFPAFNKNRYNIPNDMDAKELDTCLYDPKHPRNKHCPIFTIRTITELSGHSFSSMKTEGGVIEIIVAWDCNFDSPDECLPTYSFHRLDRLDSPPRRGFHLRYSDHHNDYKTNIRMRDLYRAYGIRVLVTVHGHGRKFDFWNLIRSITSGTSLFAIPALVVSYGMLRLFKMCQCCASACCCACSRDLSTACIDNCCCKPLDEKKRCEEDKDDDDLRETNFIFHDAIKTCSRRGCLCGDRDKPEPKAVDGTSNTVTAKYSPGDGTVVFHNPIASPASRSESADLSDTATSKGNQGFSEGPDSESRS